MPRLIRAVFFYSFLAVALVDLRCRFLLPCSFPQSAHLVAFSVAQQFYHLAPGGRQRRNIEHVLKCSLNRHAVAVPVAIDTAKLLSPDVEQEILALYDAMPEGELLYRSLNKSHAQYVARLAAYMAAKMGLSEEIIRLVYRVGLFHDVAKSAKNFWYLNHIDIMKLVEKTSIPSTAFKFYPFFEKTMNKNITPFVFLRIDAVYCSLLEQKLNEKTCVDTALMNKLIYSEVCTAQKNVSAHFRVFVRLLLNHGIESYHFVLNSRFKSLFSPEELKLVYYMFAFHHMPRLVKAGTLEHLLTQILAAADIIEANNDGVRLKLYQVLGNATELSLQEKVKGGTFNIININRDSGNFEPLFYWFTKMLLLDQRFVALLEDIRSIGSTERRALPAADLEYINQVQQEYDFLCRAV